MEIPATNTPNTQQLPAGMGAAPAAPVVPVHNPILSHITNPPTIEEVVKQPAVQPLQAPVISLPTASTPVGVAGDLVSGVLADPQVKLATSYIDALADGSKLDVQRALGKSINELDSRFIDEAYIKEVLGDKAASFLETAKSMVEYIQHQRDSVINGVYESAGGEAQWSQAVEAFSRVASAEEQATLSNLLDSADSKQVKYAAARILEIARASGAVLQHSPATLGKGATSQGLSATAYQAALTKEGRNIPQHRYDELRSLRALGKQQGL